MADLEKKARRERRLITCVAEAGFYLLPGLVRTYAPCGETPLLKVWQTRDHLSVMSGITTTGKLAALTRPHSLSGQESVLFLRHLLSYFGCWLLVIWDGGTIHRSKDVKQFLATGGAPQIHLERFPAYAPELNPDGCETFVVTIWPILIKSLTSLSDGCAEDLT